jgi:hypothetical protein
MTDAHEIDPDAPLDPEQIADDARKSFKLTDRLQGMKHRTIKVPIFTDVEAVDAYSSLNSRVQALVDSAGKVDLEQKGGAERHAALLAEHERLEPELEAAKVRMLQGALSVQLRAYPNIVIKIARRDARKKFIDEATKTIPVEREGEYREYIDLRLLSESILQITDSEGAALDVGPREEVGKTLSDMLPPSQWQRLYDAFMKLTLTDQIAESATDDPGF